MFNTRQVPRSVRRRHALVRQARVWKRYGSSRKLSVENPRRDFHLSTPSCVHRIDAKTPVAKREGCYTEWHSVDVSHLTGAN